MKMNNVNTNKIDANKPLLRVILAAAAVLILCGIFCGAAGAADQSPFPDDGVLESTTYTLTGNIALFANLSVPNGVTCTIDLAGYELKGTGSGSVITIKSGGCLTLEDSSAGKTGKVTGGRASFGGGVYVNGGTFTMNSGCITENTATMDGGGVWVYNGGTFTMNGGSIVKNTANTHGGGVYLAHSTFTMKNSSSITGNSSTGRGGGVYVGEGGRFDYEGSTIIHSNTPDNVIYPWGEFPELDYVDFNNGTAVLLNSSVIRSVTVTDESRISEVKKLYSNHSSSVSKPPETIDGKKITVITGAFMLTLEGESGVPELLPPRLKDVNATLSGQLPYSSIKDHTDDLCLAWKKDGANEWVLEKISGGTAAEDGAYRFTKDFTSTENGNYAFVLAIDERPKPVTTPAELEAALTGEKPFNIILSGDFPVFQLTKECIITQTGTLDLNGKVIKAAPENRLFTLESRGNLTITDSSPDTKHYFSKNETTGLYTYEGETRTGGLIELTGGCLTGGKAATGGGILVSKGGTLVMDRGAVVGNTAVSDGDMGGLGGGVSVGISVGDDVLLTMNSELYNNGTFTLKDGYITGNSAAKNGGGIFVHTDALFGMTGGSITSNTAGEKGAGVYLDFFSTFMMNGGSVTCNTAGENGGVYGDTGSTFNVSGTSVIKDNTTGGETAAASNMYLREDYYLTLAGTLNDGSEIHITSPVGGEGEKFGRAVAGTSGAEHFVADVAAGQPLLIGSISGEKLVWKVKPAEKKSSSTSQGTSIWLTAEPTTAPATPAPTPTPTPEVPQVKPVEQKPAAQTGASPAPVMGVLAGLGCAAVVFGLRMRRKEGQ